MNASKFLVAKKIFNSFIRCYQKQPLICPARAPYRFIVTLLDTNSRMGEVLALLLKQNPIVKELRLYDDADPFPIGLDLSDIDTSTRIISYAGEDTLKGALEGSDMVINCGGYSTIPYDSYEDLFERNADDIRRTAIYLTEFNREAIFCIARPPVDSLVPMVFMEYRKAGVKDPAVKIVGLANEWSMRVNSLISKYVKDDAFGVTCPIICGASAETAVAVISGSNHAKRIASPRSVAQIHEKMQFAEEEVLSMSFHEEGGPNSLAYAPAVAAYRLVNNVLRGLRGDYDIYDCAFVRQEGHLNKFLPYMTSITSFGRYGVNTTHMPVIQGSELHHLKYAYPILKAYIHLGESYVHGLPMEVPKPVCAEPCETTKLKTAGDDESKLDAIIKDPFEYEKCLRKARRQLQLKKCESCA